MLKVKQKVMTECPGCLVSLKGQPIPKKDQEFFGGAKFFRRDIALYDRDLDCTTAYKCPDCGYIWAR